MFVRTKEGKILNCFKSESMNLPIYYVIGSKTNSYVEYQDVKKVSENIIDIVEVGDYVNGFRVEEIGEYHSIKTDKVEIYAKVNCSALLNCFYEEDIKSIVTREQFSNMEYRIGD